MKVVAEGLPKRVKAMMRLHRNGVTFSDLQEGSAPTQTPDVSQLESKIESLEKNLSELRDDVLKDHEAHQAELQKCRDREAELVAEIARLNTPATLIPAPEETGTKKSNKAKTK